MTSQTTIPISAITNRLQVRSVKPRGVEMLKGKIARLGYLPERPLLVMSDGSGGYQLLDGNHRLEAALALGITTFPAHIVTEDLDDSAKKRRARQANDAAEAVVPTTFVDDAELIWRELEAKDQSEVGEILGWSREKVAQYAQLRKLNPEAWKIVVTTFDDTVTLSDDDRVTESVTTVTPFTEGLLRSIVSLSPDQQLELISNLASGAIDKRKFKNQAEAYRTRNEIAFFVRDILTGIDEVFITRALIEVDRGAYDQDWRSEGRPKLTRLIQAIREEWEQKVGIQLICGDFNEEIRKIEGNTIDLILTDPPYGISEYQGVTKVGNKLVTADFDGDDDWDTVDPEEFIERLQNWCTQWARVLRPGGAIVAFTDKALISDLWAMFKQAGLKPKNIIVWEKANPHPAGLARKNLISATEFMVWAVKPGAEYTFNPTDLWDRRNVIAAPLCSGDERIKTAKGETLHPTQKPARVLQPLLDVFSNRGDLVLDGFAGVGSTGKVARDSGRKFVGIEMNHNYFEAMQRRLA